MKYCSARLRNRYSQSSGLGLLNLRLEALGEDYPAKAELYHLHLRFQPLE